MESKLQKLLKQIKSLPYGRNSVRSDYLLVPIEQKGACSTKHAYIKHIASQNDWKNVQLFIGIYLMNNQNTVGVGTILEKHGLDSIPEAHTYLKIDGIITDVTGLAVAPESFEKTIQTEVEITPNQIGEFKVNFHQSFMSEWAVNTSFSTNKLWEIREACIQFLSS